MTDEVICQNKNQTKDFNTLNNQVGQRRQFRYVENSSKSMDFGKGRQFICVKRFIHTGDKYSFNFFSLSKIAGCYCSV